MATEGATDETDDETRAVPDDLDIAAAAKLLDDFLKPDADERLARRRAHILRAATELFVRHGYRKTSMEDVAGAAGVAKGTVYLYYRSKADLLLHAIALHKQQYLAEMAPAFDPALSPRDRLHALIARGVVMIQRMPLMARSAAGDHEIEQALREADPETVAKINSQQTGSAISLLDAATGHSLPRAVLEKRAAVLVDLIFAVSNSGRRVSNGMPLEEYASALADVIVDGIIAAPSSAGN